jgi:glycosyltransferase involved in cell wall biosynthesis
MLLVDCTFVSRGPGGIPQDNRAFAREFEKLGGSSFLFDKGHGDLGPQSIELSRGLRSLNKQAFLLNRTVENVRWEGNFYQTHLTGLRSPSLNGVTFLRIHDLFPISNPEWFTFQGRRLFNIAIKSIPKRTILVCNSFSTQKVAQKSAHLSQFESLVLNCKVFPEEVVDAPCGVCDVCVLPPLDERYLLAVGTIEPRKNYLGLIEAWTLASSRSSFKYLVVAGKKGWKSGQIVSKFRATKNLLVVTPCNYGIKTLYRNSGAFISTSFNEGFDMPSLEALSFGLPSALSDIDVHREMCADALFFNPHKINEVANAILTLEVHPRKSSVTSIQKSWSDDFVRLHQRMVNEF